MNSEEKFYIEDSFIESPIFDNWFKKHYPQKSLLICSPYIKKDALDKVLAFYKINGRSDFDLKVLIRGNANEFTYQKSSDIAAFDPLICMNNFDLNNVRRVTNLHMKAYLVDGKHLLITSGNLTNSGMFVVTGKENFEGGIATNNIALIDRFLKYFSSIWSQGESLNDFYDELMSAYTTYIEKEYTDSGTLQRLNRKKYKFKTKSKFDGIEWSAIEHRKSDEAQNAKSDSHIPSLGYVIDSMSEESEYSELDTQAFSLDDIPPVGRLEHIPEVLKIVNAHDEGVSYLELGRSLRVIFSDSESNTDTANRKFGEEKGKFAAFLDLVNIEDSHKGKIIKISSLGRTYLKIDDEAKNKLIKDIFFDKPMVVSIMRRSFEASDFDLLKFLIDNCEGATRSTLLRKVGPLKSLFEHISSICTEDELKNALNNI